MLRRGIHAPSGAGRTAANAGTTTTGRSGQGGGGVRRRPPIRAFAGASVSRMAVRPALVLAIIAGSAVPVLSGAASPGAVRDDLSKSDLVRVRDVTAPPADFSRPERYERMSGGAATSLASINANAFSHPSANLTFEGRQDFAVGNGLFRKVWVAAPASTRASDGLGPLFNARACQRCHIKDGRGHPPDGPDDLATSMVFHLSVPPSFPMERTAAGVVTDPPPASPRPEPTYGVQLQDFAVPGIRAEGRMRITYEEFPVELHGSETASLRRPTYSVVDLAFGPMAEGAMLSPRIAPPMVGLGLLEAVHPADIHARADPDDSNGDGISGRPSVVLDGDASTVRLGRFGWKASTPSCVRPDRTTPSTGLTARRYRISSAPSVSSSASSRA